MDAHGGQPYKIANMMEQDCHVSQHIPTKAHRPAEGIDDSSGCVDIGGGGLGGGGKGGSTGGGGIGGEGVAGAAVKTDMRGGGDGSDDEAVEGPGGTVFACRLKCIFTLRKKPYMWWLKPLRPLLLWALHAGWNQGILSDTLAGQG